MSEIDLLCLCQHNLTIKYKVMSKISIRKATADDSQFLAKLMLKSTRSGQKIGIFDLIFDSKNELELLEKLTLLITSNAKIYCHYSNFLIASIDDKDMGTLCNYEPRIATSVILEESLIDVGMSNKYMQSAEMVSSCLLQTDKRVWMFDFFAIEETHRGLEILNALLKKSLLTASLKGYRIVRTVVKSDAVDMILLYKKVGFTLLLKERCEFLQDDFVYGGVSLLEMHL